MGGLSRQISLHKEKIVILVNLVIGTKQKATGQKTFGQLKKFSQI